MRWMGERFVAATVDSLSIAAGRVAVTRRASRLSLTIRAGLVAAGERRLAGGVLGGAALGFAIDRAEAVVVRRTSKIAEQDFLALGANEHRAIAAMMLGLMVGGS